ncbi:MAG: helix-turn-helix transcriptional regulator [Clostridia bacterium]|nr:helix-turn-helix transcriptional regulator [Clostridia bacterium]
MRSFVYHETLQHGTPDFPAEYHYVDAHHPRYVMPFHWHKEWELLRVVHGTCTVYADDRAVPANAGDVVLWHDSMLHGCIPQEGCEYECFLFDLHGLFRNAERFKQYLRPFYRSWLLPQLYFGAGEHQPLHAVVSQLMNGCRETEQGVVYNELLVLGSLCNLFAYILEADLHAADPDPRTQRIHRVEQVKAVLEYIEQEYASPITLDDLARVAGMSRNYFCRVFREITQQTPIDYLLHYRVEKAAAQLVSTSLSVTDIAMDCGFNDQSYFIRMFKRLKGVTPKQYQLSAAGKPVIPLHFDGSFDILNVKKEQE